MKTWTLVMTTRFETMMFCYISFSRITILPIIYLIEFWENFHDFSVYFTNLVVRIYFRSTSKYNCFSIFNGDRPKFFSIFLRLSLIIELSPSSKFSYIFLLINVSRYFSCLLILRWFTLFIILIKNPKN